VSTLPNALSSAIGTKSQPPILSVRQHSFPFTHYGTIVIVHLSRFFMVEEVIVLTIDRTSHNTDRFTHVKTVDFFHLHIRFLFAYAPGMFGLPDSQLCDYAIRCKQCNEAIPAPVKTMPDTWIIADCPLCGAKRRYLPTDIFRGRLSHRLTIHLVTRRVAHG
jgi:hypothetical protein